MKKIKVTKKQLAVGVPIILIVLGIITALTYNAIRLNSEVSSLKVVVTEQRKQIDSAQLDIRALNGSGRVGLAKCLDDATKDYDNSLKSTGRIVVENGQNVTYHDMPKWQSINDRLNSDRAKCNEKYQ